MADDPILRDVRPSWWNFFWYLLVFVLIVPLLVALVMYAKTSFYWYISLVIPSIAFLIAAWKHASLRLYVYPDRIALQTGILSKQRKTVACVDVRVIDTRQTLFQRIVGIGDLLIGSAGTGDYEVVALGIPKPTEIKDLIVQQKQEATGADNE